MADDHGEQVAHAPEWIISTPIAHRGLHDQDRPENSLSAFENAAAKGYGFELDVHVTADGQLVVMHDPNTLRTTGVSCDVANASLAEVQRLCLIGSNEHIPSLDQVLQLNSGRSPVLIEIKPGAPGEVVGPLIEECVARNRCEFAVQSFDPRIVAWFAGNSPAVVRGQLSGDFAGEKMSVGRKLLLRSMAMNVKSRPHFLAYDVRAITDPPLTLWRRLLGVPVLAWTVRDQASLHAANTAGANIIFEEIIPE